MRILGIDYGEKKIGLAFADSFLADPLEVIRADTDEQLLQKVGEVIRDKEIQKVVVGVSQGQIAQKAVEFGKSLEKMFGVQVVFEDETLTTNDAQELSIKAGIKRKKRKQMEDAYAAALILQNYLDVAGD